jgi:tRNA(Ile2) C34 agmatinyltransferase TiaS
MNQNKMFLKMKNEAPLCERCYGELKQIEPLSLNLPIYRCIKCQRQVRDEFIPEMHYNSSTQMYSLPPHHNGRRLL